MAKRLIPLFASLLAIAFFVTRCPIEAASADYPVPQGPASINAHDAGSYPHLTLTVPALPHCDGGESYVPADGGGMQCGVASSGGGAPIVDGGFSVFLDGASRPVILPIPLVDIAVTGTPVAGAFPIASTSTAAAWEPMGGDCSMTSGGLVTCVSAQQGEVAFGASTGTLTAAAGATAPGLAQASESTTQTPIETKITPQVSTHATNQDGSSLGIYLSALLGGGAAGKVHIDYGGTRALALGDDGSGDVGLWAHITAGSEVYSNALILQTAAGAAYVTGRADIWLEPDGDPSVHIIGATGETNFGYSVAIGTTGGGTYGGGTNTEYFANGTAPTSACTGGTCLESSSAGGLAAFGPGDGTFPNVTTLQGAWTSPSTTYSALAFGRGPSCGFTTTGTGANGCSFTIPVRATFGSTITMNAITSAKCVGASSGCQVGSGSTPPDVWTQSATAIQLLFAPDGTPGSYSTHGSPTSVTSYATTQAGDSCALSASASTITLTCTPVVVTGTPILWWEVRILDLEIN